MMRPRKFEFLLKLFAKVADNNLWARKKTLANPLNRCKSNNIAKMKQGFCPQTQVFIS